MSGLRRGCRSGNQESRSLSTWQSGLPDVLCQRRVSVAQFLSGCSLAAVVFPSTCILQLDATMREPFVKYK
jgi:hypothetical protein